MGRKQLPEIRKYELVVILQPDLQEAQVYDEIGKIAESAEDHGGSLAKQDVWGKKQLAYPIEKKNYGIYVVLVIEGSSRLIEDLSRQLRINDNVLRHLAVAKDKFSPDLSDKLKEQGSPLRRNSRNDQSKAEADNENDTSENDSDDDNASEDEKAA